MTTKARGWSDARKRSWVKECKWPPEARKGKETDSPLEYQPFWYLDAEPVKLISDFLSPELEEKKCVSFYSTNFLVICHSSSRKLRQTPSAVHHSWTYVSVEVLTTYSNYWFTSLSSPLGYEFLKCRDYVIHPCILSAPHSAWPQWTLSNCLRKERDEGRSQNKKNAPLGIFPPCLYPHHPLFITFYKVLLFLSDHGTPATQTEESGTEER